MTQETQEKLLEALDGLFVELSTWLKRLGVSEAKVVELYDAIIRENGLGAKLITDSAKSYLPLASNVPVESVTFKESRTHVHSEEYAAWLLDQPEPSPEELGKLLTAIRDALADAKGHLMQAVKVGPQHKHGGRPKELDDPKKRQEVCERVKQLRGPGSNLQNIFRRVGREYGVSDTTIKRIWSEGSPGAKAERNNL
ncbi:MAG TPA: hypothetical protein VG096_27435 [Bryobacteraceae bacterium]|nr:hypothetical protein [Bryobacteraceae bacterium]